MCVCCVEDVCVCCVEDVCVCVVLKMCVCEFWPSKGTPGLQVESSGGYGSWWWHAMRGAR